jgi:hypothetical protein
VLSDDRLRGVLLLMTLDEVLRSLGALPPPIREEVERAALDATAGMPFVPNIGPQTEAYHSDADELFYGGAAGGGKSSLLCGYAITRGLNSILFRREYKQLKGLVNECARILGSRDGYGKQEGEWHLPAGNTLEFGAVQYEDDKENFQGRPHDFVGFDEITHFTESQYRFLIGWNRPADPSHPTRCRVIAAGNPPLTAEGAWVVQYWAPWLDDSHPNPAKEGELRWFTTIEGKDQEVDGPGPHGVDDQGLPIMARSRSFIMSRLENNPELAATGYANTLNAMPEPMRTMLRSGRFDVLTDDDAFQVIPTHWLMLSQSRWEELRPKNMQMTAMGVDVAGGGPDSTTIAMRFGGWFDKIKELTGDITRDGSAVAAEIIRARRDACPVVIDAGGGYGGAATLRLRDNGIQAVSYNGANQSTMTTRDGAHLRFVNKRAESWWRMREALDPSQEGGSVIALPPDPKLRADLVSPRWSLSQRGILIESKDQIRARIGRSPDRGDAVVMALSEGDRAIERALRLVGGKKAPTVSLGYSKSKELYGGRRKASA